MCHAEYRFLFCLHMPEGGDSYMITGVQDQAGFHIAMSLSAINDE